MQRLAHPASPPGTDLDPAAAREPLWLLILLYVVVISRVGMYVGVLVHRSSRGQVNSGTFLCSTRCHASVRVAVSALQGASPLN